MDDLEEEAPLSVSELIGLAGDTLGQTFSDVLVAGELTSFSAPGSGHRYFTIADDSAAVSCVMWRGDAGRLAFRPEAGDEVLCRGRMGVFEKQGRMQLYVRAMKPVGAGAAQKAFEALKKRLTDEGLFSEERKRPLPYLPRTIGLVTSRTGAVLHDVLTTLERRFPPFHLVLSPAAVQGAGAPAEIVRALALLERDGRCDVVIVGRGGGAAEDLAAFNDESVVRAVAAYPVPVVSAVGHEVDVSLCDLAADHRAATPTAAAEAVVPVYSELCESVDQLALRLRSAARRTATHRRDRVAALRGRLRDPRLLVAQSRQAVDHLSMELERSLRERERSAASSVSRLRQRFDLVARGYASRLDLTVRDLARRLDLATARSHGRRALRLGELRAQLDALSPLRVLDRGYSLVRGSDGRLVRAAREVSPGDVLQLHFRSGGASAVVEEVVQEMVRDVEDDDAARGTNEEDAS